MATAKFPSGLRVDQDLLGMSWGFEPSMGISARAIDRLGLDIRSFREPLKRSIQQVVAPSFKANFDAEGRPIAWAPYSEATRNIRQWFGYSPAGPILARRGLLKKTIQQLNIWTIDTQKAAIVDLPQKIWYGKIHQAGLHVTLPGTHRSPVTITALGIHAGDIVAGGEFDIPQRQFVMLQPEDLDKIQKVFDDWLDSRITKWWVMIRNITGGGITRA